MGISKRFASETYVIEITDLKVDKVDGKGLSSEDFTTEEKEKLASIVTTSLTTVTDDGNGSVTLSSINGSEMVVTDDDNGNVSIS